jgi:hypothetical protein
MKKEGKKEGKKIHAVVLAGESFFRNFCWGLEHTSP